MPTIPMSDRAVRTASNASSLMMASILRNISPPSVGSRPLSLLRRERVNKAVRLPPPDFSGISPGIVDRPADGRGEPLQAEAARAGRLADAPLAGVDLVRLLVCQGSEIGHEDIRSS